MPIYAPTLSSAPIPISAAVGWVKPIAFGATFPIDELRYARPILRLLLDSRRGLRPRTPINWVRGGDSKVGLPMEKGAVAP
jgi:hypothetical protein